MVLLDIYWPAAYRHSHDDESKEAEVIVVGMHPPLDDFVRQLFHEDRDRVDVFVLDAKHNDIPTDITHEIKQYPTMLLSVTYLVLYWYSLPSFECYQYRLGILQQQFAPL